MSPELIGTVATGEGVWRLVEAVRRDLGARIEAVETRLAGQIAAVNTRIDSILLADRDRDRA